MAWTQIPITGTFIGLNGESVAGRAIIFSTTSVPTNAGQIVGKRVYTAILDATGSIPAGFTLPATNDPTIDPRGWAYTVDERFIGGRDPYQIFVPYTSPGINLATVTPVSGVDYVGLQAQMQSYADAVGSGVRSDLASTASGKGAALVGFLQNGTGAVNRTMLAKAQERISVKDFGAAGDGITNDSASLVSATTAAAGGIVRLTPGTYLINSNTTLPSGVTLMFDRGAILKPATGVSLTVNSEVQAGEYQVFDLSNVASIAGVYEAKPEWFGCIGNGAFDNTALTNKMIASGVRAFRWGRHRYRFTDTVTLPQQGQLWWIGQGAAETIFDFLPSTPRTLINYLRNTANTALFANITGCSFVYSGTAKAVGATGIKFYGADDTHTDNWLRVSDCFFYYWESGVSLKWAGQCHFLRNFHQGERYSYALARGASFQYFRGIMSFSDTFIRAQDTIYDAFSNGITISNCNAITAIAENIYCEGFQAVFIDSCGFDLGSGGSAAVWFKQCQDVYIDKSFISSNVSTTRDGVSMDGTHTWAVTNSTIVNNNVGVRVTAPTSVASKGSVFGCKFDGNDKNDLILLNNTEGVKHIGNHHSKQMSRTGTNYEVYGNLAGVNNNIICENTFAGTSYTITAGAGSLTDRNIFGVKV